jgi:hypothetical protein
LTPKEHINIANHNSTYISNLFSNRIVNKYGDKDRNRIGAKILAEGGTTSTGDASRDLEIAQTAHDAAAQALAAATEAEQSGALQDEFDRTKAELSVAQSHYDRAIRYTMRSPGTAFAYHFLGKKNPLTAEERIKADIQFFNLQKLLDAKARTAAELDGVKKSGATTRYMERMPSIEELDEVFNRLDFSELNSEIFTEDDKTALRTRFAKKLKKHFDLSIQHKSFSGQYTEEAIKLYDDIEKAVESKDMVTAGTTDFKPEDLKEDDNADRGLNAEHIVGGIAQNHAYTVMGVNTKDDIRYVKLKNPWGLGVASYITDESGAVKGHKMDRETSNEGFFLFELNDFMSLFSDIAFSRI